MNEQHTDIRILIAEDDEDSLIVLQRILRAKGYEVDAAANGVEALAMMEQNTPNLIISDIMMPEMDGYDLCRQVKADHKLNCIPFIFYTATYTDDADKELGMALGASLYVMKPQEPLVLIDIIQEVLGKSQTEELSVPQESLKDEGELDKLYMRSVGRKLDKKVKELERDREALKKSEERLQEAQQISNIGHWEWDILTNDLFWSDQIYRIFGVQPRDFDVTYEAFLEVVHPEDRENVTKAINEALNLGESYDIEHQICLPDGSVRIVHEQAKVFKGDTGKPIRMMGTVQDITERKQAEESLELTNRELHRLSAHLQHVREEEKAHIAREIHDELGSTLTLVKLDAAWLKQKLGKEQHELGTKAGNMVEMIDSMIATTRRLVTELRPTLLDDLGLWAAVEWHVKEFEKRTGIKCVVQGECNVDLFSPQISITLYRVLQEALTNVARHASATQVKIKCRLSDDVVMLTIEDNGIGFEKKLFEKPGSYGIRGMYERAGAMGGSLNIESEKNSGTSIEITLPMNGKTDHE